MPFEVESKDRSAILIHYYRAMVGRADVWRTRMDTTTNWAIGATAAISSFTLGAAEVPHFVIYIGVLMTFAFLQLEARRLTFYHLWQQRVLLLENGLIRAALEMAPLGKGEDNEGPVGEDSASELASTDLVRELDDHLGRTVPSRPRTTSPAGWTGYWSTPPVPASAPGGASRRAGCA